MIRRLAVAVLVALAWTTAHAEPGPSFDYDASRPMPPVEVGPATTPAPGIRALPVSFVSDDRKITGEVIEGVGAGPHPGVLFVHWLGEPKTTNHTEFEPDAIALAKLGVTSLLVDAPWSKEAWFPALGASADADIRSSIGEVIDLRRSVDVLAGWHDADGAGVDPARIAFVGHDFGAMFGAMLASVDPRPSWYVLMAPNSSLGEWYLWRKAKPDRAAYMAKLAALDIAPFLQKSKAKGFFFQFSARDIYIPQNHALALAAAAPQPKRVVWYDVDHSLVAPSPYQARVEWLTERLLPAH